MTDTSAFEHFAADALGLDLTKWQFEVIESSGNAQFKRAAPGYLLVVNVSRDHSKVQLKAYPADVRQRLYDTVLSAQKTFLPNE